MKRSTSTIQIDLNDVVSLKSAEIVGAFINALPPRVGDLHGTSVEFFFEKGDSCCIEGSIIDVGPKEEAYSLRVGKAMAAEMWQKGLLEKAGKLVIETVDLRAFWSSRGLDLLLAGPREVQFYRKVDSDSRPAEEGQNDFEAVRLYVPGSDKQSIFLYASEDSPGDVVVASGVHASEFNGLVEVRVSETLHTPGG